MGFLLNFGGGGDPLLDFRVVNDAAPTTPKDYGAIAGLGTSFTGVMTFTDASFQSVSADEIIFMIAESPSTFNNYIQIYKRNSGTNDRLNLRVRSGGAFSVSVASFALGYLNGTHKLAVDVAPGRIVVYLDGLKIFDRDTAFTFPVSLADGVNIGQTNAHASLFGGTFSNFEFYTASARAVAGESWLRNKTRNTAIISGKTFDPALDVIAFMGQSNSSGRASGSPSYTNTSLMKKIPNNFTLAAYSDPYDSASGSLLTTLNDASAAVGHAGFMLDTVTGTTARTTAAAPLNLESTAMSTHWGRDLALASFQLDSMSGTKHAGTCLASAVQGLITLKTMGNLKCIVWHQGESDAANGVSQATYQAYLEAFFNAVWGAVGSVPVILNTLHMWHSGITSATQTNWNNIIAAQTAWAATKDNVYLNDISDILGGSADRIHLDLTGQQTVGQRAAVLYLANIG